jgi:HSP20 family molecular chaperone IbpA
MLSPFFGFRGLFDTFDNTAPYGQARETTKGVILELEVPRYEAKDLSVDVDTTTGRVTVIGRASSAQQTNKGTTEDEEFGQLIYASSPLVNFQRTYYVNPQLYDLSKLTTDLRNGVFYIRVPKLPPTAPSQSPKAVTIFGSGQSRELVPKTTPQEFAALQNTRWPPALKREEKDNVVVYRCNLPPTVSADHIDLTLRGSSLVLTVNYATEKKDKNYEESQSMSYSTSFLLPDGTKPEDIHTEYKNGELVIQAEKHPNPKQAVSVNPETATKK